MTKQDRNSMRGKRDATPEETERALVANAARWNA